MANQKVAESGAVARVGGLALGSATFKVCDLLLGDDSPAVWR